MSRYTAFFGQAEDGTWSGHVPDLPGVLGMGNTLEEAKDSVREATAYWIEDMHLRGHAIPEPSVLAEIEVAA